MSLLIKALDKAEKSQKSQQSPRRTASNLANVSEDAHDDGFHLELEPVGDSASSPQVDSAETKLLADAERAANVFEAKRSMNKTLSPWVWIFLLVLFAILGIGGYMVSQLQELESPPLARLSPQTEIETFPSTGLQDNIEETLDSVQSESGLNENQQPSQMLSDSNRPTLFKQKLTDIPAERQLQQGDSKPPKEETTFVDDEPHVLAANERVIQTAPIQIAEPMVASPSVTVQISKNKTQQGPNPLVIRAYEAYQRGDDGLAQSLYKEVLKQDGKNVDALLGMGAIAEKEARRNDALDWYGKVLSLEPRNPTALVSTYDLMQQNENKEESLKAVLSKHPNDFNAQADLGSYYAQQGDWPLAQQAFFEAYRLNPVADNAFNLGSSLDHMGKGALALTYYRQALELARTHSAFSFDMATLESRIRILEEK